jgi:hypothetical protein
MLKLVVQGARTKIILGLRGLKETINTARDDTKT